jgi:tripartite motif-containing protein 71
MRSCRVTLLSLAAAALLSACGAQFFWNIRVAQGLSSVGLTYVGAWGSAGSGDGQFTNPRCLAVDASGNVYVADDTRVQCFDANGNFVSKSTADMGEWKPEFMAVDDGNSRIYVTDSVGSNVHQFGTDLALQTSWGSDGTGDGQFKTPTGVTVDTSGNVYVVDSGNARVQKFNSSHTFVIKWGTAGSSDGQFGFLSGSYAYNGPQGITIDALSTWIAVADCLNNRVQFFDQTGTHKTTMPIGIMPVALAITSGPNEKVLVADASYAVNMYDDSGNYLGGWYPYASTYTSGARGIACGSGKYYLIDWPSGQVQIFEPVP